MTNPNHSNEPASCDLDFKKSGLASPTLNKNERYLKSSKSCPSRHSEYVATTRFSSDDDGNSQSHQASVDTVPMEPNAQVPALLSQTAALLDQYTQWESTQAEFASSQAEILQQLNGQRKLLNELVAKQAKTEVSVGSIGKTLSSLDQGMIELRNQSMRLENELNVASEFLLEQCETLSSFGSEQRERNKTDATPPSQHQWETIESQLAKLSNNFYEMTSRTEDTEKSLLTISQQISERHESLGQIVDQLRNDIAQTAFDSPKSPTRQTGGKSNPTDTWQAQRASLLAQYKSDPEHAQQTAAHPAQWTKSATPAQPILMREIAKVDHESAAKPAEENDEITRLKATLEAKLRKAEIEISIERAKIGRMQTELELKQADLDQNVRKLAQSRKSQGNLSDKTPLLTRLSRWLPSRSRDQK